MAVQRYGDLPSSGSTSREGVLVSPELISCCQSPVPHPVEASLRLRNPDSTLCSYRSSCFERGESVQEIADDERPLSAPPIKPNNCSSGSQQVLSATL